MMHRPGFEFPSPKQTLDFPDDRLSLEEVTNGNLALEGRNTSHYITGA